MWWIFASLGAQEPALQPGPEIEAQVQILLPGQYLEAVGDKGPGWMALRCDEGCRLEPAEVVLLQGNGAYGVGVHGGPALALIRGLPAGPVSSVLQGPQPLPRYTSVKLGAGARLVADGRENYRMMLSVQGQAQPVLEHLHTDGEPGVRFVGDLDGDGALDLILDGGKDERRVQCVLLLSSAAQEGELVAPVAEFSASVPLQKLRSSGSSALEVVREEVDLGTLGVETEFPL